jgi:hypothetical protein
MKDRVPGPTSQPGPNFFIERRHTIVYEDPLWISISTQLPSMNDLDRALLTIGDRFLFGFFNCLIGEIENDLRGPILYLLGAEGEDRGTGEQQSAGEDICDDFYHNLIN